MQEEQGRVGRTWSYGLIGKYFRSHYALNRMTESVRSL